MTHWRVRELACNKKGWGELIGPISMLEQGSGRWLERL